MVFCRSNSSLSISGRCVPFRFAWWRQFRGGSGCVLLWAAQRVISIVPVELITRQNNRFFSGMPSSFRASVVMSRRFDLLLVVDRGPQSADPSSPVLHDQADSARAAQSETSEGMYCGFRRHGYGRRHCCGSFASAIAFRNDFDSKTLGASCVRVNGRESTKRRKPLATFSPQAWFDAPGPLAQRASIIESC